MFNLITLFITTAQAQEAVSQQTGESPGWMGMVPFALMFLVFYFLILRPQARKAKESQEFLKALKKGDQVLTAGGIFGTIVGVTEKFVDLKVSEETRLKVLKSHVTESAVEDKSK
ncbi:MAG: preprotein translocase subunit YajC [Bdellovibrionales bacterium]